LSLSAAGRSSCGNCEEMRREVEKLLIVGLGNPGKKYEKTRHNLGAMVVRAFAEKREWRFKKKFRLKGEVAEGVEEGSRICLLLPTTYMNLSGESVVKVVKFYAIPLSHILIISDDVCLSFGTLRYREMGSSGGHNGLESIESCLGTRSYQRLRIGIGDRKEVFLEDFVLTPFTEEENKRLPGVIEEAGLFLKKWIREKKGQV
jgi:PTH1 family peptidyl-tRNA hydrolase